MRCIRGRGIRIFLIRTFIRRPFFAAALVLIGTILSGRYPGLSDGRIRGYDAADGRRLTVEGNVIARECTGGGYRILLDHMSFSMEGSGASGDVYAQEDAGETNGIHVQAEADAGETNGIHVQAEADAGETNGIHVQAEADETYGMYAKQEADSYGIAYVSGVGQRVLDTLNQTAAPGDRIQIFLSNGEAEDDSLYGGTQEEGLSWMNAVKPEDQTDVFSSIRIGDCVRMYGKCRVPESATNPGQFDSRRYYLARRIVLKMSQASLKGIRRPGRAGMFAAMQSPPDMEASQEALSAPGSKDTGRVGIRRFVMWYLNMIADMRIGMQRGLLSTFGEDAAQIAAFVLGDGSGQSTADRQLFRNGGLSWLLCVSSLHISLLGMMIYRILRSKGVSFVLSGAGSMFAVGSYALMAGFSLSAQRAVVTFLFWTFSQIFGRTRDTLTSLSAAALFILLRQPYALWDSAFLLSVCCILSLEYISPAIERIIKPKRSYQRKFCASLSLWLGTLPAVLWFFYQTAPLASMLYPVMLPLMGICLGFGMFASFIGYLHLLTGMSCFLAAGEIFAWPCRFLLMALRSVCRFEQMVPFSVLILGRPAWWQLVLYYTALAFYIIYVKRLTPRAFAKSDGKHNRNSPRGRWMAALPRMRLMSAAVLGAFLWMVCLRFRPAFRFTCLDIGQGSCNLIEHEGCVYLFDAGSSSVKNVWQYRIDSTLKYYGIRRVDAVFLSHADMDHVNGLEQALSLYHPNLIGQNAGDVTLGQLYLPDIPEKGGRLSEIASCARMHGIRVGYAREGMSLAQDGMTLKILSPSPDRICSDANQDCIVMLLENDTLQILFTGDLEKEGEELFVRSWKDAPLFEKGPQDLRILIAGHHGSRNATSAQMIEMVKPDLALISCGKNNRYGHPAPAMLERLEAAGVPYRRTDMEGAIRID